MTLDPTQLRVLGALIEKEITTPENYPLSLNSLISACNQRSSRDPVLDLTEDEVRQAVHSLEDMEIVSPVRDARVPKYEHRIRTVLNLRRDETAVICLLLLRGPQTPGELRGRADRMFSFDDIAAVQSTLERLASRPAQTGPAESSPAGSGPLVVQLARQPGSRESRFAHLLGGTIAAMPHEAISRMRQPGGSPDTTRFDPAETDSPISGQIDASVQAKLDAHLDARLELLTGEIASLKERLSLLERLVDDLLGHSAGTTRDKAAHPEPPLHSQ